MHVQKGCEAMYNRPIHACLPDHKVLAHDLFCVPFQLWEAVSSLAYPVILVNDLLVKADRDVSESDTIPCYAGHKSPRNAFPLSA